MANHTNDQFPEIFNNGKVRIFRNPCDEIFIEDVRSGTRIRLKSYGYLDGGLQFTTSSLVEPVQVHGMIGWRVGPR